uniref:Uncharacterized protein n=1 Tax=Knipowitschia caucasica TaxID=637954 RepID=A0AAV2MTK4_KNICA
MKPVELSSLLLQAESTLAGLVQRGQELSSRLRALQVDRREVACLKFMLLFNPSECTSSSYTSSSTTSSSTTTSSSSHGIGP